MTFAFILAIMGILAFIFSGFKVCLILLIPSMFIALSEFEKLIGKVEMLEIWYRVKERDDNAQ